MLPLLSNIIFRYKGKKFDTEYTPTIYEELPQVVEYKESTVYLQLIDTAGQEEYDDLRPLAYPDTDIFLIVFSVDLETSLENAI